MDSGKKAILVMRKAISVILLVFLMASMATMAMAAPATQGPKDPKDKSNMKFSDSSEADWATKHIARMKLQNVIQGYEDGKFRPNASVSEAEAIVMVTRWLGKEADAQALSNTDLVIPGVTRMWAWGYVKYALDNKWISTDDFQPSKAASRLWISKLLCKASFGTSLDSNLAAAKTTVLPFTDVSGLQAQDKDFISLVYSNKWMQGYPDGTFKPDKPVTRAEMATLIDRNTMVPKAFTQFNAAGTVATVSTTSIKITKSDNTTAEFTLAANVMVFERGSSTEITIDKVQVGDKVRILLTSDGKAQIITVEDKV